VKRIVAAGITVGVFLVVIVLSRRPTSVPLAQAGGSPEQCVQRLFEAAERGDVEAYLDCFAGPERERLQDQLQDQDRQEFAASLRLAIQQLKGWSVFSPSDAEPPPRDVQLTVERVYSNRTERQSYQLIRQDDRWRIHSVATMQAFQPDTAYGTPVFEMPDNAAAGQNGGDDLTERSNRNSQSPSAENDF
jgi:hypothetical protein